MGRVAVGSVAVASHVTTIAAAKGNSHGNGRANGHSAFKVNGHSAVKANGHSK